MRKMPATKDHRLIPLSQITGVGQSVKNTGAMVACDYGLGEQREPFVRSDYLLQIDHGALAGSSIYYILYTIYYQQG